MTKKLILKSNNKSNKITINKKGGNNLQINTIEQLLENHINNTLINSKNKPGPKSKNKPGPKPKNKSKPVPKTHSKFGSNSINHNVDKFKDWVNDHNNSINNLLVTFNDKSLMDIQHPNHSKKIQYCSNKMTNKNCNCKPPCDCNKQNNNMLNTHNNSSFITKQMHFKVNNHNIYLIYEQRNSFFDAVLIINNGQPLRINNLDEYKKIEEYLVSKSN